MKKILLLLFIANFLILPLFTVKTYAADMGYLSYIEIVMSTGKLIKNFTTEECSELRKKCEKPSFSGYVLAKENVAVPATYISSILVSYENAGTTDIEFTKSIEIETNMKVSFSSSGAVNGGLGGNIKKVKAEIAAKADVKFSAQYEKSIKEKKEVNIKVEGNSKMILYLTGDLLVYNGYFVQYLCFCKVLQSPYEFIILTSQYERLEKAKIDEDLVI